MPIPLADILVSLPVFALVLMRVSGLVLTAPLLGTSIAPVRIRAAFAMVLAAMMFPVIARQAPSDMGLTHALQGAFSELVIGATIGLALNIVLSGAQVAGTVAGQQAGMALSEVFNPLADEETSILAQFYVAILMLVFLAIGGHRAMLAALLDTYRAIPILSYSPGEPIVMVLVATLSAAFVLGLRVAGPVVIALFLTEAAVGFVARTVPQLNILSVGLALRNLVALAVAAVSISALEPLLVDAIWDGLDIVRAWSQS